MSAPEEKIWHLRVDEIKVGERHRRDMGDLHSLADSIERLGLLHPILVTPDNELIAGQRRLEAARLLGWLTVPTRVVDLEDLLQAEHDENVIRKDFTPTEAVTIGRALEARLRPGARERQLANLGLSPRRTPEGAGPLPAPSGNTRDIAGLAVGLSGSSYERARSVIEAAEQDPAQFGDLPDLMDQTTITGTFNELRRRQGKPPTMTRKEKPKAMPSPAGALASKRKPPQVIAVRVIDMLAVAADELGQLPLDALTQEGRLNLLRQLNTTIPTLNKVRTTIKKGTSDVA